MKHGETMTKPTYNWGGPPCGNIMGYDVTNDSMISDPIKLEWSLEILLRQYTNDPPLLMIFAFICPFPHGVLVFELGVASQVFTLCIRWRRSNTGDCPQTSPNHGATRYPLFAWVAIPKHPQVAHPQVPSALIQSFVIPPIPRLSTLGMKELQHLTKYGGFLKWGYPKMDGLQWKILFQFPQKPLISQ